MNSTAFVLHSARLTALFECQQVEFRLAPDATAKQTPAAPESVLMRLLGANPSSNVAGEERIAGRAYYYIGNQREAWRSELARYKRLVYRDIYAGVDLAFYGTPFSLEYDFRVRPHTSPSAVRFNFKGAQSLQMDGAGDLVVQTASGRLRFRKPALYQLSGGRQKFVPGGFTIDAENNVGFWTGEYDRTRELVIDPVLAYASYFPAEVSAVAVDSGGNLYIAGMTGAGLPTQSAYQGSLSGQWDGFLAKFDPTGATLIFSTYFGGSGNEFIKAIALDSQGNAYVAGGTGSSDFPTTPGAFMTQCPGGICDTPFVAKFDPNGSLVYSTLTGGSVAGARAIAVDSAGSAYITGSIASNDLPVINAFQPSFAGTISTTGLNAFVQKLDPTGSQLVYSTYLGAGSDSGNGIAVDGSGSAYVVGRTGSANFPTKNPLQLDTGTFFLTKFSPQGNTLMYSTLLGFGGQNDAANAVAVDASGNAYVVGQVQMSDFPLTLGAFQTGCLGVNGCTASQAFVLAMNSSGTGLLYSTLLGDGSASGIALDSSANVFVTGVAASAYFPSITPIQSSAQFGNGEAFVAKLNSSGTPTFSSLLGGTGTADYGDAIAIDTSQNVYVGGQTSFTSNLFAPDFPVVNPYQPSAGCCFMDAGFIAKVSPANTPQLSVSSLQPLAFVRNVSTASISISNIAVAGTGGANFAPGGSCGHSITLAPASECFIALQQTTGATPVAANITITSNASTSPQTFSVLPAFAGAPTLLYSPNTLQFGPQFVGTTSTAQKITVYNTSLQSVSMGNIQMSGSDFTLTHNCPSSLASGASCAITVRFAPTGNNTGGNIAVNYGNGLQDSLFVTGTTSPSSIYVSWPTYNFGTQYVGTPGMPRIVNLTNATSGSVTINNISVSGPYTKTTNCGASLAAQSTCRVAVIFAPTGNGPANGSLTASFSGTGSPVTINLVGIGKINADLAISPLTMDFGPALVGYTGNGGQLTLTNTSSTGLTISSFAFSDPQFSQTDNCPVPPSQLGASASCIVNITFSPTSVGPQSATLTIQNSGAGNPQVISLTGIGTTPIIFMPASLTFGSQAIGTSSGQTYIDVANNSGQPFTIQSITVHGDFQIVQNPCPAPGQQLAPFWGCALQIVFTPTTPGTINGDVTVLASDEPFPRVASLTGTGIGPLAALSSSSLSFPPQPLGSASTAQIITLANTGNATLHITSIVTNRGFGQTNTCGSSLSASANCTISVTFTPTVTGSTNGTLTIADDAGASPQTVALSGSGTDYSIGVSSGSSSASVSAGQTATYNLQLNPMAGFSGTVNITCTGAPPAATCSASPSSMTVSTAAVPFTVAVSTTAPTMARRQRRPISLTLAATAVLPCGVPMFLAVVPLQRKRRLRHWVALLMILGAFGATGCGGGGGTQSSGNPGTPKGTSTLTVKGSAGGASRTMTLSLTVQ